MTAIYIVVLGVVVFYASFTFSIWYLDFYFPFSIWTFIYLFYLEFQFFFNSFSRQSQSHSRFLPIFPFLTVCYWEEKSCKQIQIPYLLMVLLSIPLNKLPFNFRFLSIFWSYGIIHNQVIFGFKIIIMLNEIIVNINIIC